MANLIPTPLYSKIFINYLSMINIDLLNEIRKYKTQLLIKLLNEEFKSYVLEEDIKYTSEKENELLSTWILLRIDGLPLLQEMN